MNSVDNLLERMDDMKYCDFCRAIRVVYDSLARISFPSGEG